MALPLEQRIRWNVMNGVAGQSGSMDCSTLELGFNFSDSFFPLNILLFAIGSFYLFICRCSFFVRFHCFSVSPNPADFTKKIFKRFWRNLLKLKQINQSTGFFFF